MGYKDPNRAAAAALRRALNKEIRRRAAMEKQIEQDERHIKECPRCEEFVDVPNCNTVGCWRV